MCDHVHVCMGDDVTAIKECPYNDLVSRWASLGGYPLSVVGNARVVEDMEVVHRLSEYLKLSRSFACPGDSTVSAGRSRVNHSLPALSEKFFVPYP